MSDLSKVLKDHRHGQDFMRQFLARIPNHPTVEHVVDDRTFLFGLEELYRTGMKEHERTELLAAARELARKLGVAPSDAPVEGYYAENADLAEYFRLMRGLQNVTSEAKATVASMHDYQRLLEVLSSPIFGEAVFEGKLLPRGRDSMSRAMKATKDWNVNTLTVVAHRFASESDDYSLAGLACLTKDPVVIAALRESVVLYAEPMTLGVGPLPVYLWRVSPEIAKRAQRFVTTFNALFKEEMPAPTAENADYFGAAALKRSRMGGRCARLGQNDMVPPKFYHWAIYSAPTGQLAVHDFWHKDLWTTARYSAAQTAGGGRATIP